MSTWTEKIDSLSRISIPDAVPEPRRNSSAACNCNCNCKLLTTLPLHNLFIAYLILNAPMRRRYRSKRQYQWVQPTCLRCHPPYSKNPPSSISSFEPGVGAVIRSQHKSITEMYYSALRKTYGQCRWYLVVPTSASLWIDTQGFDLLLSLGVLEVHKKHLVGTLLSHVCWCPSHIVLWNSQHSFLYTFTASFSRISHPKQARMRRARFTFISSVFYWRLLVERVHSSLAARYCPLTLRGKGN